MIYLYVSANNDNKNVLIMECKGDGWVLFAFENFLSFFERECSVLMMASWPWTGT